jgi:putative peptidoglycan lipid II flippase
MIAARPRPAGWVPGRVDNPSSISAVSTDASADASADGVGGAAGPGAPPPGPPAPDAGAAGRRPAARGVARNTAIFSIATGLSRIAGLVREIVASSYFATSGAFSAFTIAFQVPNVVRSLFADAALSAAFVPVFTELLEQNRRRDAFRLASTLFLLILAALGAITAFFILVAGLVMPLFTPGSFGAPLTDLTVGLSRVMFPIVLLLGLNGLLVGILNAYDHFSVPALSPLVWNTVIVAILVAAKPFFEGDDQLYAYAIGVLIGTLVQFAMAIPVLRRIDFRLTVAFDLRDPRVKQVLKLMVPVTVGLGLINFNLLINSFLGALISVNAPRAIDAAFRIYMLPQGIFSVAVATVLFPALSRLAAREDFDGLRALTSNGLRQIFLMLIPAAAVTLALAEPLTRLIYEHGEFGPADTNRVSSALFWFSFSLPFAGANLLLTRTFFSLRLPWITTKLAGANLLVNVAVSAALYKPLGIPGVVIGTAASSAFMTVAQMVMLRRELRGRLEVRETLGAVARITIAAAVLGGVSYAVWAGLDAVVGRALPGQLISVGVALVAGGAAYVVLVLVLRVAEARQIEQLVRRRLSRG